VLEHYPPWQSLHFCVCPAHMLEEVAVIDVLTQERRSLRKTRTPTEQIDGKLDLLAAAIVNSPAHRGPVNNLNVNRTPREKVIILRTIVVKLLIDRSRWSTKASTLREDL